MTPDQVVQRLQQLRYEPRRNRYLGLAFIARRAGIGRATVYRAIDRGSMPDEIAAAIAPVLEHVSRQNGSQRPETVYQRAFGPLQEFARKGKR